MAKQYYIKKDPAVNGPNVEWVAINGREFYQLFTSPAGRGRYFIDMDDFMIEDGGAKGDIHDQGADTEAEAIASIARRALNTALNSLDPESYLIIDALILSPGDKSERDLASEFGISQNAVYKRKEKILKNLKFLVVKAEKSQQ